MEPRAEPKYILSPCTQVREEEFGLLFYTMAGPCLYFLSSGRLLNSAFFQDELNLDQWIQKQTDQGSVSKSRVLGLKQALKQLKEKGVILEC